MKTFESRGFQAGYIDDRNDDADALLQGVGGRVGKTPDLAAFR